MFTLLISLIAIYLVLDIGWSRVSAGKRWLVHLPFSIYLGWVTVATIANVTSVLYWAGWDGWGIPPQMWAVVMLVVGLAVATSMSYFRGDVGYLAVIIWAYVGIAVKQWTAAPVVGILAAVFAAIVTVTLVAGLFRRAATGAGTRLTVGRQVRPASRTVCREVRPLMARRVADRRVDCQRRHTHAGRFESDAGPSQS